MERDNGRRSPETRTNRRAVDMDLQTAAQTENDPYDLVNNLKLKRNY